MQQDEEEPGYRSGEGRGGTEQVTGLAFTACDQQVIAGEAAG